jgi:hypothetical protein
MYYLSLAFPTARCLGVEPRFWDVTMWPAPRRRRMWLELPLLFPSLARKSDLGRPGDVHALVPSPRIALVVLLELPESMALVSVTI